MFQERVQASTLRRWAQVYLQEKNWPCASALAAAATILLEESGGTACEEGVWLLIVEGKIANEKRRPEQALEPMRNAIGIAARVLGPHHPATIIASAGMGETLLNLSNYYGARHLLQESLNGLRKVEPEPFGEYNREWRDRVIAEISELLAQAQTAVNDTGIAPCERCD